MRDDIDPESLRKCKDINDVYALLSRVQAESPYTSGHCRKVNTYAVALAEAVGLSTDELSRVGTAALLHDIGKIGVPYEVLNRIGRLNEEDLKVFKTHPKLGADIIRNIPQLAPCVNIVLYHHERWDGGGYPKGLKGEEIPMEARIISIAESFDAMISDHPHCPALPLEEAIEGLKQGAGSQFDPELVNAFIGMIEAERPGKE
jgi:putative nucleotidyltransferase with HDIG domain